MTAANHFLECVWQNQLFATFTQSGPTIVFPSSYSEIFISILAKNLSHSYRFSIKILSSECSSSLL